MRNLRRKACRQCGEVKTMHGYYRHPSNADGFMNDCKRCHVKYVNENRALKPELYREIRRAYDERRRAKRREYLSRPDVRERLRATARENYRLRKHAGPQRVAA